MKKEDFQKFNYGAIKLSAVLSLIYGLQYFYNLDLAYKAFESPFWKFFTSFMAHAGPDHLFNNIFFIALFGSIYELHTSEIQFYRTFLISALFANLAAFIFFPNSYIIGASGGAMGILAALSVLRPNQIGLVFGIPAPMYMVLLGYLLINFAGITGNAHIAYQAHLMGIVAGGIIGYRLREKPFFSGEDDEDEVEVSNWEKRISRWEKKYMKD
ncbi:MAG: rhomboid family intramembrane serine protease [Candidatus Nanohalobium sp.]